MSALPYSERWDAGAVEAIEKAQKNDVRPPPMQPSDYQAKRLKESIEHAKVVNAQLIDTEEPIGSPALQRAIWREQEEAAALEQEWREHCE